MKNACEGIHGEHPAEDRKALVRLTQDEDARHGQSDQHDRRHDRPAAPEDEVSDQRDDDRDGEHRLRHHQGEIVK